LKAVVENSRIQERRRERQQQICQGAMKIFRKKGFNATTMRDIAEASQVSLGNLYNYISRKEDILFLIHSDVLNQIHTQFVKVVRTRDDPVKRLINVVGKLFDLTCKLKDEMLFIYTETKSLKRQQMQVILKRESQFVEIFENLVEKVGQKERLKDKETDLIANLIVFTMAVYPLRGWNVLPKRSKEELRHSLIRFILRGAGVSEEEFNRHMDKKVNKRTSLGKLSTRTQSKI
jgi:AcrR family transcriptional regulator